jgi:type I restriction enzyme, R subunit
MTFTESNTVEQMILDAVTTRTSTRPPSVREKSPGYADSLGGELRPARWNYLPAAELPRQNGDVMVEPWVREALIKHNTVKRMISDGAAKGGAEVPG